MNTSPSRSIVIRPAGLADSDALRRLAQLDSAAIPHAPLLLAEQDGELRAARSLRDGAVIADPFHATEALVVLLEVQAAQLASPAHGPGRTRWALGLAAAVSRALRERDHRAYSESGAVSDPRAGALPVTAPILRIL